MKAMCRACHVWRGKYIGTGKDLKGFNFFGKTNKEKEIPRTYKRYFLPFHTTISTVRAICFGYHVIDMQYKKTTDIQFLVW